MDSLLANYVSSDEEDGEQEQQQQEDAQHSNFYSSDPQVSEKTSNSRGSMSASLPRPKEPAKSKPSSSIFSSLPPLTEPARSKPSSSIFSPLPSPKNSNSSQSLKSLETPNDDGDAPQKSSSKPSSLFGSLPPPKSAAASAKTKRVVEFKPPVNSALLYDDEDETLAKRARGSSSESKSNAASSSSVGGLAALLPPPKNAVLGGGGGGDAGRRSVLEVSEPSPSTNSVVEPSVNVHESYDNSNGEYDYSAYSASSYSGSEYGTNPQQGVLADPQQGGLGAGEMAWSQENYSYVQNWEVEQQQQQHQYAEIAVSIPGGNRAQKRSRGGRNEVPSDNIIEVRQEELVSKRPREDQVKLTGIAFGPAYKPVSSAKDKPSKLHKRKHQIGSLYFDLKQKEMELAERRAKGQLTKAETQAKYGW